MLSSPRPKSKQDVEKDGEQFEDALDRHVDDVLKSPSKWRRTLMGVWSFLKTRTFASVELLCVFELTFLCLNSYGSKSRVFYDQGLFLRVASLL